MWCSLRSQMRPFEWNSNNCWSIFGHFILLASKWRDGKSKAITIKSDDTCLTFAGPPHLSVLLVLKKSPIFLMGTIAWWPILDVRQSFWPFISKLAKVLKKTFKYFSLLPINLTKGTKEGWGPKIDKFFSNFSGMVVTTRWRSFE